MKTAALIANPHAGRGKGAEAGRLAAEVLRRAGWRVEVRETKSAVDTRPLARAVAQEGPDCVVAVGGDGTLHEVLNGLHDGLEQPPPLGLIPVGGGNDYARMLELPANAPERAAQRLLAAEERWVDLGRLEGGDYGSELFLNNVGLAYMAEANAARESTRFLPGKIGYLAAGALAFARWKPTRLLISIDGVEQEGAYLIVHVGLGRYCGAGIELTPDSSIDGGRFHVFVSSAPSRVRGLLDWGKVSTGQPTPDTAIVEGRRVRITGPRGFVLHADGEIRHATTGVIEATVLPGAGRLLAPPPSPAPLG
ncbi:MAG: diacylglycerol kinase family lipid kinase [Planctomycetes bacterium]|nr:diacylglycerol kinase family lipid kinase [Planctomycetota bacterium]